MPLHPENIRRDIQVIVRRESLGGLTKLDFQGQHPDHLHTSYTDFVAVHNVSAPQEYDAKTASIATVDGQNYIEVPVGIRDVRVFVLGRINQDKFVLY